MTNASRSIPRKAEIIADDIKEQATALAGCSEHYEMREDEQRGANSNEREARVALEAAREKLHKLVAELSEVTSA